jgi:peroxiredoxin family protein
MAPNGNGNGVTHNGSSNGNGSKPNKAMVISTNTLVPLGAVVAVFLTAWQVQAYLAKQFMQMQVQLDMLRKDYTEHTYVVNHQLDAIRAIMGDRWTSQDMKIWEQELKIRNPNLNVPNSVEITRDRMAPK